MDPKIQLSDVDLKIMSVVWDAGGEISARKIHDIISKREGYERPMTYQSIHRCINRGALERTDPGFVVRSLIGREEVQIAETKRLVDKLFGGSTECLLVSLVDPGAASQEEIDRLRSMVRDIYHSES